MAERQLDIPPVAKLIFIGIVGFMAGLILVERSIPLWGALCMCAGGVIIVRGIRKHTR